VPSLLSSAMVQSAPRLLLSPACLKTRTSDFLFMATHRSTPAQIWARPRREARVRSSRSPNIRVVWCTYLYVSFQQTPSFYQEWLFIFFVWHTFLRVVSGKLAPM
jgi:hypothetical protein